MMGAVTKWTGLDKAISLYKHISFAGPRTTTGVGVALLSIGAVVHVYWLASGQALAVAVEPPVYLLVYFAVHVIGSVAAVAGMVVGLTRAWYLGSGLATATVAVYLASRVWGLPGLAVLTGWWHYPLGTVAMILAALFLGLHVAVLTKVCIAHPHQRGWHD